MQLYTIGYDFGDTFVRMDELQFAVRLFTVNNVYAPDPQRVEVRREGDRVTLAASGLSWAGNQRRAEGSIELEIARGADGRYIVTARGSHASEECKSIMLEVLGLDVTALTYDQNRRETLGSGGCIAAKPYPGFIMKMPLVFVENGKGQTWYALSKDRAVRGKSFAVHEDPYLEGNVLDLVHQEDARRHSFEIDAPPWHIGRCEEPADIVRERCADLESHFNIVPYERRSDVPAWLDEIKLVTILHGEHWTGHVFQTFAEMERSLHWIAERMPAHQAMAFLPAWDGRYYHRYPIYEPSEAMGGAEGFASLVATAHRLGFRIVPMLGANGLNLQYAEALGLRDVAARDRWGTESRINWVDWDYDLSAESNSVLANLGHPAFREHMIERAAHLVDTYGVDGIFLDVSSYWINDPVHSPYEGTLAWAAAMKSRYPDLLLFGENSYDALWGAFSLFHEGRAPGAYEYALYRYARQTHYLAHPAPGKGSGGVHEWAWPSGGQLPSGDTPEVIPTLSIVADTLTRHADEAEAQIAKAKAWRMHLPGLAGVPF